MTAHSVTELAIANECLGAGVLPRIDEPTEARGEGSAIHGFLSEVGTLGVDAALDRVKDDTHRDACRAIDLNALPLDVSKYTAELAFEWEVESVEVRILGTKLNRAYPRRPGCIYGTVDVAGVLPDAVVVLDYKVGWGDLRSARDHFQIRTYGAALAKAYGKRAAIVGLVRLRNGGAYFDVDRMDGLDIEAQAYIAERLVGRLAAALEMPDAAEKVPLTVGEHCARCPSFRVCPAQQTLARQVVRAGESAELAPFVPSSVKALDELEDALTPANAPDFYRKLSAAEAVIEKLRAIFNSYATRCPVDLGDGRFYGVYENKVRDDIDSEKARPVIVEGRVVKDDGEGFMRAWGPEVFEECMVRPAPRFSTGALEEAIARRCKELGLKKGPEIKRVRDALRRSGAAHPVISRPVGVFKKRERKGDAA